MWLAAELPGIAAALSAAEAGGRVTILEGQSRPAKKLLVTGNGRCNLGNTRIAPEYYHTARPDRLEALLEQMPATLTTDFFAHWGLMTMADEAGRLYPYCRPGLHGGGCTTAGAAALRRCDGNRLCGDGGALGARRFYGEKQSGRQLAGRCADFDHRRQSRAQTELGAGAGYALAKGFGHSCTPLYPCLTALRCTHPALRGLKGIRVLCTAALCSNGGRSHGSGELQLTEYGVSGIPAMQLSCRLGAQKDTEISVDFFPDCSAGDMRTLLNRGRRSIPAARWRMCFWDCCTSASCMH